MGVPKPDGAVSDVVCAVPFDPAGETAYNSNVLATVVVMLPTAADTGDATAVVIDAVPLALTGDVVLVPE